MSVISIQAPISGLNGIDSVDDMSEGYAVVLDNWIPGAGACFVRGGSKTLISQGSESIDTLFSFNGELYFVTDGVIYNSNINSTQAPVSVKAGLSNSVINTETYKNVILLCNGEDAPMRITTSGLVEDIIFTSGITDPHELVGANSFKGRMFYHKEEGGFYYCEANSYQGELTYFDLSPQVDSTAVLKQIFQWSNDAGDGVDDYCVFLFDNGQALVYQGTDPSSFDQWAIVGKYNMGRPLSIRSHCSFMGDEIVLTRSGWQNFKNAFSTGEYRDVGVGKNVGFWAVQEADRNANRFGWEVDFFPEDKLVIVNIPTSEQQSIQHVMNTNTMAWSTFSGWNAKTFCAFDGRMFFGSCDGKIVQCLTNTDDDGTEIITNAVPAYNYLGSRANQKLVTGLAPVTTCRHFEMLGIQATSDYKTPPDFTLSYQVPPPGSTDWGSEWGSPWTSGLNAESRRDWRSANKFGYAHSYRMRTISKGQIIRWYSTQVMFTDGGVV